MSDITYKAIIARLRDFPTDLNVQAANIIEELMAERDRLREALKNAERFLSYFSGETNGFFEGSGTPRTCLATIRATLRDGDDRDDG